MNLRKEKSQITIHNTNYKKSMSPEPIRTEIQDHLQKLNKKHDLIKYNNNTHKNERSKKWVKLKVKSTKPTSQEISKREKKRRTIASTELRCAGLDHHGVLPSKSNGFTIHLRSQFTNFHICPSPQTVPFRVPENNLVLHRSSIVHTVPHFPIQRRREVSAATSDGEVSALGGLLLVALVEPFHGGVAEGARGVHALEDSEGEENVVVLDALVLVLIGELESEDYCGVFVVSGI